MVKGFIASAALAAASIASVAQAASLKQDPLIGCEYYRDGYLSLDSVTPLGFVAGHTEKSLVTGKKDNSVLDSTRPDGSAVDAQYFELLNCTQSLKDRGYKLDVPQNLLDLATQLNTTLTYTWGPIQPERGRNYFGDRQFYSYALSVRSKPDDKGRLDNVRLLETKVADTPIEARTFVGAYDSNKGITYLDFYPFAGSGNSTKSGVFYAAGNKYGSIDVSTKHATHANSTFLRMFYD